MGTKIPMIQSRRRRSHVAGRWGWAWLHANEWGGLELNTRSLRTVNGFVLRTPWRYITVLFRRREMKL